MKVLIVSQYFWPESFRINAVAEALQKAGCEVSVLTGQPNYPEGRVFSGYRACGSQTQLHPASGATIFRVPLIPRGRGGYWRLTLNYLSFLASSILIGVWVLRRRQFDVVFVYGTSPILQGITGAFFSLIKRAALILWVQDLWPESLSATGYIRNRFVLDRVGDVVGWCYRCCDLLLVQSRSFIASVSRMSGEVPVVYFPNPGGAEHDIGDSPHSRIDLPAGFNVTFSGNIGTAQSPETMIEAAALLAERSDINFVIVGHGSCHFWMEEEVRRRGLKNVLMVGRVEPEIALDALSRSDALLVTLRNVEPFNRTVPSKLSTYLGVGKPIIACMGGEGADIVRASEAGLVCEADNAQSLAAAVLDLAALPTASRDAMGAAGRRWYTNNLELQKLTARLLDYFRETLSLRRREQQGLFGHGG